MDIIALIISLLGVFVALSIGIAQICISKKMKGFETRQDKRDELRRQNEVCSKAIQFIQKYNKNGYASEILLLPFCVSAYKYNAIFPYHREIYRDFCCLTEDVQNEILKQQKIDLKSVKYDNYYSSIVFKILNNNRTCYPNDSDDQFFYEDAKYFRKAITEHGFEPVPDNVRCDLDTDEFELRKNSMIRFSRGQSKDMDLKKHIENLLRYHKNEKPLSDLFPCFQDSKEIVASYICCLVAKYTAFYNSLDPEITEEKELNLGNECEFSGQLYMEDLFLSTLHTVENYNIPENRKCQI